MRFRPTLLAAMAAAAAIHGSQQCYADLTVHGITVGLGTGRYDRFAGDPNFIGSGIDWSGIGRMTNAAVAGEPLWGTLISPNFFVTADHTVYDSTKGIGGTLRYYPTNSSSTYVDRVIEDGWALGNDLWLGKLETLTDPGDIATMADVAVYPIFNLQDTSDYLGQEIHLFGQSGSASDSSLRQRLGRNVISSYTPTSQTFGFTYSASVADIAGPNGISDAAVDSYDWDVFQANFGMSSPAHLDGDVNDDGVIDLDDGQIFFDEGIRMTTVTGGLGWDEAMTQSGDSGGPSFRMIDGKPALVGVHWEPGTDRLVSDSLAAIASQIATASGGAESPVSLTGRRGNFFSSKDNLTLPEGLQKLNVFRADLNGDFVEDAADIDFLNREIQAHITDPNRPINWATDLDNDHDVDANDRLAFLEQGLGTFFGDADLNGIVALADDVLVAASNVGNPSSQWPYPDELWRNGDFDGDGLVTLANDFFPATALVGAAGLRSVVIDINDDGLIDSDDVDLLAGSIRNGAFEDSLDMNRDEVLNSMDLEYFVMNVLGTLMGDLDLDGVVSSDDLYQAALFMDVETNMWSKGDVNGDGWTDQDDLDFIVAAIQTGNQFAPPPDLPALPIPEPTGTALLATAIAGFIAQRRRVGV